MAEIHVSENRGHSVGCDVYTTHPRCAISGEEIKMRAGTRRA
jgi:hypothetical protein